MTTSHYQRLGVTPAASPEEVRAAYRGLARRLHPDGLADATPAERRLAERRMREVNEAWHVLRDPERRRAYDGEREAARRPARAGSRTAAPVRAGEPEADLDLVDVAPSVDGVAGALYRHLPWVVLVVVLGAIFVATAYAGSHDPADSPVPRRASTVGTCVDVAPGPVTTVVPCSGPHELRIVTRVGEGTACPDGTERRRLGVDGLLDCVDAG